MIYLIFKFWKKEILGTFLEAQYWLKLVLFPSYFKGLKGAGRLSKILTESQGSTFQSKIALRT